MKVDIYGPFNEKKYSTNTVMGRIKTLQDAKEELGDENELVKEYDTIYGMDQPSKDLLSYMRLRIIVDALNEGWKPDFTDRKQNKYWPWFWMYSEAEWNAMSDTKRKSGVFFGGSANSWAGCGFLFADTTNTNPSLAYAGIGSRICFKSKELAEYAGLQFAGIYFDFLIGGYGKQD